MAVPNKEPDPSMEMDLARAACAGDRDAFGQLFNLLYGRVHRTVWAMLSDESEAHDVAQEAWIKAWRWRERFNFESAFSTWVHRIAVNTALDWLRKRKRLRARFRNLFRPDSPEQIPVPVESDNFQPSKQLQHKELGKTIERAIAELPEEQRMVLVLREYEGYSYEEIAQLADCKLGTVMSRLHLARKKLQHSLSKEMS